MADKKKDSGPLLAPTHNAAEGIARAVVDIGLQSIPVVGGPISRLLDEALPSVADQKRHAWEESATDRINENTGRIDEVTGERSVSITGFPAELLLALVKDCPDGLCSKRYELSELLEIFPENSKEEIQEASYELEQYGLLRVTDLVNGWMVRLDEGVYEQVDQPFMGWNPLEDAVTLAKLMVEKNEGTAAVLRAQLDWPTRRFNPAQRIIVPIVPEGCVRRPIQSDYVSVGIGITAESRAALRRFIRS